MKDLFKSFDMYASKVGFEVSGAKEQGTLIGSTLTLIVIIACSVLSFLFSREAWLRDQPISYRMVDG